MSFLGEMVVRIVGQNAEFDKSIDQSESKLRKFSKTATNIGKSLTTFVTLPIAGAAVALTKAASDAEETEAKFGTVFASISKTSEEAATSLADNFGLSSTKAKQLLGDTGDLLSGFGFTGEAALELSTQVNELAVDLASFTNFSGGAEGASAALTKALLGERESIKSLGIAITEADIKRLAEDKGIVGELDRQTKAALTLELALRQSKNAIGDFARTQDGLANQVRILQSEFQELVVGLGKELIPIAKDLITFVRNLVKGFSGLSKESKRTILVIAGIAAAIGPLISLIGALNTALLFLAANPLVLVLGGVAALTVGVIALGKAIEKQRIDDVFEGVTDELKNSNKNADEFIAKIKQISNETGFTVTQVIQIAEQQGLVTDELQKQVDLLKKADEQNKNNKKSIQEVAKEQSDLTQDVLNLFNEFVNTEEEVERIAAELGTTRQRVAGILVQEELITDEKKQQLNILRKQLERQTQILKATRQEESEIQSSKREARLKAQNDLIKKGIILTAEEKKQRDEINSIFAKLNAEFDRTNINIKLYGDEIDGAKEKQESIREAIQSLIDLGLTPQSKLIQRLIKQYAELGDATKAATDKQAKDIQTLNDVADKAFAEAAAKREKQTKESLEAQTKLFEEQVGALTPVLASVSQVFATTLVESGGDAWLAFKEAGKEAVATVLDSLGQLAATYAAISFVPGLTFNPAAGAGYLAAAAGAFTAAGLVRALADGGVVTSPTFAQIGEAGTEAVLPLERPDVMRQIGRAIASQMSGPVNNVFQPENNVSFPEQMVLQVDGQQFRAFITNSSRNGQILISESKGLTK